MPTAKKEANVAELKELVEKATIMIGAEYRGLTVREMTTLRRALRDAGVEARVVKNKLFRIAATQAGVETAGEVADGPSLVIFGFEDIVAPSKAVADYQRAARNTFAPKKVFFDGTVRTGRSSPTWRRCRRERSSSASWRAPSSSRSSSWRRC